MQLGSFEGFQWDGGNETKNWNKHKVSKWEAEQVFFNNPILLIHDGKHSQSEARYFVLGRTDTDRRLLVVFTRRGSLIRVISARDMSKREREFYERDTKVQE
jgi:uncharacterized DUF497 family protein